MKDEELFRIDLNTLKVLKVLGQEKSTKRAAERMEIGQPAISKALKKLREQHEDPLFNRTLHGIEPTPKCESILGLLPRLMDQINELFDDQATFEPSAYEGNITIHINSSLCHPLSMLLIEALNSQAPKASLVLDDWNETTEQQIRNGAVHLGINYHPLKTAPGISSKTIFQPNFKFCCRQGHPLTQQPGITIQDVASYPIVLISMAGYTGSESVTETYLKRHGYLPNVLFRSDRLDACADVLRSTNAIAPVAEIIQPIVRGEGLALLPLLGFNDVQQLSVAYYTSAQTQGSPLMSWLIATIEAKSRELIALYSHIDNEYTYDKLSHLGSSKGGQRD